jgi:adenine-specific DNA-methyltransferase
MKLLKTLEDTLKKEPNYITDNGEIKKWVVIHKAQNFDADLLEYLLDEPTLKETFFKQVKDVLVFNQNAFIQFLEQKNYLNDSYTAYKNKVGLTIDGKYLKQRNEVALVWPFKDCILEGGQSREEDKREEIFFNEILAQDEINQLLEQKVLTNAKKYTVDGEKVIDSFNRNEEGTITDNLIIKGNNLLALHSLKQEFAGKVKLIYIDPPYNTGNDSFNYNDSFNHSTWLTFMKNRLSIANELLCDTGALFIQCDDIEFAYLKILTDEIFGKNNFINSIAVRSSTASGMKTAHKEKTIIKQKDLILAYKKGQTINIKPQYTKKEKWDTHYSYFFNRETKSIFKLLEVLRKEKILTESENLDDIDINDKKTISFLIKNKENIFQTAPELPHEIKEKSKAQKDVLIEYGEGDNINYAINGRRLTFLSKTIKKIYYNQEFKEDIATLLCDFWNDIDFQNTQNEGGVSFPAGKKPEVLLYRIIDMITQDGDLILDFHLGSGTTAVVSHKMNRQYIGIEQLDYAQNDSIKRLQNVINGEQSGISKGLNWKGGGSFIYLELKKYNQTFIEQIQAVKDTATLLSIWEAMKAKSFLNYNVDIQEQEKHIAAFKADTLNNQKQLLIKLLDKNQLYVNLSSINDKDFEITAEEKKITNEFYRLVSHQKKSK